MFCVFYGMIFICVRRYDQNIGDDDDYFYG